MPKVLMAVPSFKKLVALTSKNSEALRKSWVQPSVSGDFGELATSLRGRVISCRV
jgi:hypothetical protein